MLAAQLYKAADDEGCVSPEKVEKILGISKDEAESFVDKDQSSAQTVGQYPCMIQGFPDSNSSNATFYFPIQ